MQTLAVLMALVASSQLSEDVIPESIPAPPGFELPSPQVERDGPPVTLQRPGQFAYATGHIYPDVAPEGIYGPRRCHGWMYPNGICGHRCVKDPYSWGNWWFPPGNMVPHYPYQAAEHGYYYFKPYNVTRVSMQQAFVDSYGGDPRNPYSNDVFKRVYKIYGKRHGADQEGELPPIPPVGAGFSP